MTRHGIVLMVMVTMVVVDLQTFGPADRIDMARVLTATSSEEHCHPTTRVRLFPLTLSLLPTSCSCFIPS